MLPMSNFSVPVFLRKQLTTPKLLERIPGFSGDIKGEVVQPHPLYVRRFKIKYYVCIISGNTQKGNLDNVCVCFRIYDLNN